MKRIATATRLADSVHMGTPGWLVERPIAHRGLHGGPEAAQENSMAAFRRAVEHDVPFELDVQLTRDGRLAIVHNETAPSADGGSIRVADAALEQLSTLTTLQAVLDMVDGEVPVLVDIRRWRAADGVGLEERVAAALREYQGPVAVHSFDPRSVYRIRKLLPAIPVGQVSGRLKAASPLVAAIGRSMATNLATRPDFISFEISALPSRPLRFWRRRGLPVIGWTAHSPAEETAARADVDNVFFSGYLPEVWDNEGIR